MAIQIPKINLQTKLANTQAQQAARQAKGIATPGLDKRLGVLNTKIGNTQAQIDARTARGLSTPGLTNRLGTAPSVTTPAAQTKVNLQTKLANTQAQQAARQARGIATPGLDKRLGVLNTKIGNTQAQIDARTARGLSTPGLTNRLGTAPSVTTPAAQTTAISTNGPTGTYAGISPRVPHDPYWSQGQGGSSGASQGVNPESMFPTTRMFEPQNYEGSPLYQFQVKAGEDQLAKSLAARGLTNSGYGIKQELNIPMMAAAQDTQRMTDLATRNADRLQQYQQAEALRQERAGNNQWDRSYQLAQLMADQNPMQWAMSGLNNYGNTMNKAGQSQANYLAQLYQKVLGGGGGGAQPLPLPTGPNYNNINPADISNNYNTNNGWINLLTQGLNSFFPQSQVK